MTNETNNNNQPFKLLWTTDIHLDHCHEERIRAFCRRMKEAEPDAIVITGDISNASQVVLHLGFMDLLLENQCPIFFVLGNHDYYNGLIVSVREEMRQRFTYDEASKMILEPRLGWLGSSGVVPLTEDTALVGHDGWYDGQYANWFASQVRLNDYVLIGELGDIACPVRELRFAKINELAKDAAAYVEKQVKAAFVDFDHVFVATHVAPWPENSVYAGKQSDADWLPHFSSKAMGDVLYRLAQEHPQKRLTVLCGHSHGEADVQHLPNLRALTGKARYRNPKINKVFEL